MLSYMIMEVVMSLYFYLQYLPQLFKETSFMTKDNTSFLFGSNILELNSMEN